MGLLTEGFLTGKVVEQEQDEIMGSVLYKPTGFVNFTETEVAGSKDYDHGELFAMIFRLPGSVAKGTTTLIAVTPFKMRILYVIVQCDGAETGGTVLLDDGTTAITDAMICAVDQTIVEVGTINDAIADIASGGALRAVTASSGTDQADCQLTIIAARVE